MTRNPAHLHHVNQKEYQGVMCKRPHWTLDHKYTDIWDFKFSAGMVVLCGLGWEHESSIDKLPESRIRHLCCLPRFRPLVLRSICHSAEGGRAATATPAPLGCLKLVQVNPDLGDGSIPFHICTRAKH
jgi:hypothetical protein